MIRAASGDELEQLVLRYGDDPRRGVQRALAAALHRSEELAVEQDRLDGLYGTIDAAASNAVIIGIDEVGRGAIAGPLYVAAVVLPPRPRLPGLDDSKRLSARQRQSLATMITDVAIAIGLSSVEASEIDRIGMSAALRLAISTALSHIELEPDLVLLDGNRLGIHPKERAIISGDSLEAPIAAASIIAKVTRDELMVEVARSHPEYSFESNKGYASPEHIAALQLHGATDMHRKSFLTNILSGQERLF
ncbi:MAG: ribonuclease HII [Coriobacteriia bacterium]|nr:ribonuclease HII [Coriobacteriia bacterium]